jgi:hypothetical protein
MKRLDTVVQPSLTLAGSLPDGSKVHPSWEGESCLKIAVHIGSDVGLISSHELCIDFTDPNKPVARVGNWEVCTIKGEWIKAEVGKLKGSLTLNAMGEAIGKVGGPDLLIQYEYFGFQLNSNTYQKGEISIPGDQLIRK